MFLGILLIIDLVITVILALALSVPTFWAVLLMAILNYVILFLIWAVIGIIATIPVDMNKEVGKENLICRFYADCITDGLMSLFRIRIHRSGYEKIPKSQFLLVSNHRSALDPLIHMRAFWRYRVGFVGKESLFHIPVIRKLAHMNTCIPLVREDPKDAVKMIHTAVRHYQESTSSVGIYPEGTRNHGDGLLPFKAGAFKIAKRANVPVLVVYTRNSDLVMKNYPWHRTDVYVEVCDVMDADFVKAHSTADLSARAEQSLLDAMKRAGCDR